MINKQVIIIGAGIAGLSAAWYLKKQGIQALVLEADHVVGGRMKSIEIDDLIIDCGAQFLSSAYSIIPQLIQETGLNDEFVATHKWVGIKNQDITLIHTQKPWTLVSSRLLSFWDWLRLGYEQVKLFHFNKKPINDLSDWAKYDNQSASDWVLQHFGKRTSEKLIKAILNGFYFQSLSHSSASMVASVLAFSTRHPKTMALKSGMNSLAKKLAEKLNVKTNVTVSSVIETKAGIKILTNAGEFNAAQLIVTVPALIAKNIIQNPDKEMSLLLETQYSSTILLTLLIDESWSVPAAISSAYGFILNPECNTKIAALTIENNKRTAQNSSGFVINVMLADKCAKDFFQLTEEEIFSRIRAEIEEIFPGVSENIYKKAMFRWEYAMPYTPIGRASAVSSYRSTRHSGHCVWLAGDYLGLPWTDSAAQTGLWAAEQVAKRLTVSDLKSSPP